MVRCPIREQDPLKQGLKPHNAIYAILKSPIREQDPLKQGLKHTHPAAYGRGGVIREQDPIKQGLKHNCNKLSCNHFLSFVSKIH